MQLAFGFFLRLFLCFVAAKLLLRIFEVASRDYLLALTAILLVNAYLFEYLAFRDRKSAPENLPPPTPAKPPSSPEDT